MANLLSTYFKKHEVCHDEFIDFMIRQTRRMSKDKLKLWLSGELEPNITEYKSIVSYFRRVKKQKYFSIYAFITEVKPCQK